MDLVDEQDVARFEVGQQRSEVAGLLEHRARGLAQVHVEFGREDMGERGLAEPRWPEDQHMVERLAAAARGLDRNAHLLAHGRLADVIGETLRADRTVDALFLGHRARGNQSIVGHGLKRRQAWRIVVDPACGLAIPALDHARLAAA